MFKLYVRPHLEYCVEVWNPQYAGDMCKIEKSQNKMTKLLKHGRLLSPKERNDVLGIESHEERRLRGDLIYMYKNIDNASLFELRSDTRTRGNDRTIKVPFHRTMVKRHSFSYRNVRNWNNLPDYVVNSSTLNNLKTNYDFNYINR